MNYVVTVSASLDINVEADSKRKAQEKAIDAVRFGNLTDKFVEFADADSIEEGYDEYAEDA